VGRGSSDNCLNTLYIFYAFICCLTVCVRAIVLSATVHTLWQWVWGILLNPLVIRCRIFIKLTLIFLNLERVNIAYIVCGVSCFSCFNETYEAKKLLNEMKSSHPNHEDVFTIITEGVGLELLLFARVNSCRNCFWSNVES